VLDGSYPSKEELSRERFCSVVPEAVERTGSGAVQPARPPAAERTAAAGSGRATVGPAPMIALVLALALGLGFGRSPFPFGASRELRVHWPALRPVPTRLPTRRPAAARAADRWRSLQNAARAVIGGRGAAAVAAVAAAGVGTAGGRQCTRTLARAKGKGPTANQRKRKRKHSAISAPVRRSGSTHYQRACAPLPASRAGAQRRFRALHSLPVRPLQKRFPCSTPLAG